MLKTFRTKAKLADQTRKAAAARIDARAGGCIITAGVETAALEMARVLHRDACRDEASREAARRMPAAGVTPFGEPLEGPTTAGGWA